MPEISIEAHLGELARKTREEAERMGLAAGRRSTAARYLFGAAACYEKAAELCRDGDRAWERYRETMPPGLGIF